MAKFINGTSVRSLKFFKTMKFLLRRDIWKKATYAIHFIEAI